MHCNHDPPRPHIAEAALAKLERRLSLRLYVGGVVLALLIIGERFVK
jgi:hypothetical protein